MAQASYIHHLDNQRNLPAEDHIMKWLKRIVIALVLLLSLAAVLPFFITLNDYIPQIEKTLSDRTGETVSIANLRFAALPLPHVTVSDIAIGTDVSIGKVTVTPDLYSLWQPVKVIKSIEIDSLTLTQQAISKIPAWAKTDDADKQPQVRVESVILSKAHINLGKSGFGPFDAHVNIGSGGEPEQMTLTTQDGKLKAQFKTEQAGYLLDVSAHAWTLPVGPALLFDELSLKGVATLDTLKLSQVSAKLYGGSVKGRAGLAWKQGMKLDGNLDIRNLEVQRVAYLVLSKSHISGRLTAQPVFSTSADSVNKFADRFMAALQLQMPFSIQDGVLKGVDIEKAATQINKHGSTGGETRFETLSGYLDVARGNYHFTQLKIASGALSVDGHVDISPKKNLAGRINAQVSLMGASASVPLNVTGTVDSPTLFPTGAAMTGAAVGTVLLGPGMGTAVGVKVGDWVDNLFGKKPKK